MEKEKLMINIYDSSNIQDIPLDKNNEWHQLIKAWMIPILQGGTQKYIQNLNVDFIILTIDDLALPITINNSRDNSYIANIYNYLAYARDEIKNEINNPLVRWILNVLVTVCGIFFRLGKLEKVVCVNNWLVSTNVVPNMSTEQIYEITEFFKKRYPSHALVWRSINDYHHTQLQQDFKNLEYSKVTSRLIYLVDPHKYNTFRKSQKKHLASDRKALNTLPYEKVDRFDSQININRVKDLYNQLYIQKYSKNNPQYSLDYFELARKNQFFKANFLIKDGEVQAFGLSYHLNNIISNPLIGYDTSKPKSDKLYRMLTYKLFETAKTGGYFSHRSSGVGNFKKHRGAKEYLEYFMIYYSHLSLKQKIGWRFFELVINKIATPFIQTLDL
jgi:hypothetical protein